MWFSFNNYFIELKKIENSGQYDLRIIKVTGPAIFDRKTILETTIHSIDNLTEVISTHVPNSNRISINF